MELRKKNEEAAAAFKAQNEKLNEQLEAVSRNEDKANKTRAKLESEIQDLTQRYEQEKKKRETAEKNAKSLKTEAKPQPSSKVDAEELRQLQSDNDNLKVLFKLLSLILVRLKQKL